MLGSKTVDNTQINLYLFYLMRLSKKVLTAKEADSKIQLLFQMYFTIQEDTLYRESKVERWLDRIDKLIMLISNESPEKHIEDNKIQMVWIRKKIHLDYWRFVDKVINKVW